MIDAAIVDMVRYGVAIALESAGDKERPGKFLCAQEGGPVGDGRPFELTGRKEIGPWERWKLFRG